MTTPATITTRSSQSTPLTWNQMDANFTSLQSAANGAITDAATANAAIAALANSSGAGQIGYTLGAAGTVSLTAQSKFQETVSITDFGGKPDGSDAGIALNAAITYLAGIGGGAVTIPAKVFTLATPVTLKSNVVILAFGATFTYSGSSPFFTSAGTSSSFVVGCAIYGATFLNKTGSTSNHGTLAFLDSALFAFCTFSGIAGANASYWGLYGCKNTVAHRCNFINGSSIIWNSSDGTSSGTWGFGNRADECIVTGAPQGFDALYQNNLSLYGCIGNNMTGTYGCGFVIEYQNNGVVLTACTASGNVRDGFYVEGKIAAGCKSIIFNNCIGVNNGEAGLNLDANYQDVQVNGGSYNSNTGTFSGGTGHGIMAAGSYRVSFDNPECAYNAANGIYYSSPYLVKIKADIHDNVGAAIVFSGGAPNTVRVSNTNMNNNGSNTITGWTYIGGNEWDQGPWQSWTPVFTKSNLTTVVTLSNVSAVFRSNNGRVEYQLYADTPSSALDASTFFSLPIAVTTGGDTTAQSKRPRGTAFMNASGCQKVDSLYSPNNLRIALTSASDTSISVAGNYEYI